MVIRGVRGAVQADADTAEAIRSATRRLLEELVRANLFESPDIVAAFFTVTDDLTAAFPAAAARDLGWTDVPMLCNREIPVPAALPRAIRVLLLVNTRVAPANIKPVYLGAAQCLRPDLAAPVAAKPKKHGETKKLRARLLGRSLSQEQASTTSSEEERP